MTPTAATLRAAIAARQLRIYEVAGRVGVHPARLGRMLKERSPLSPDLATRILDAVEGVAKTA